MTVSVGLVGYGYAGATIHAPLIVAEPRMTLTAVATSHPEEVTKHYSAVRCVATPAELFASSNIDAVVLATPNLSHYPLAEQALRAGKHVVIDKPMVVNSSDGKVLIDLARRERKILTVFHNRRWDGDFLTVSDLLRNGTIGTVRDFESRFDRYRPEVRTRWREDDLPGSGLLYDLGSHLIDQVLVLFGKPHRVFADLRVEREGARTTDAFDVILDYGGHRARLRAGMLVAQPSARFRIEGEHGGFVKFGSDSQEERLRRGERPGDAQWGEDSFANFGSLWVRDGDAFSNSNVTTRRGSYEKFYQQFASTIENDGHVPVDATDANKVVELIEAAMKSHQQGSWIEIESRR